ncbi:hypothetical protein NFI95_15850 [Acetobacteraceae bacterium KSS8]|uniref:Cyclodeaminase/cyclohydrolase domain-containing protein n=1 Tax=Endosaccharibacter trunci TaxID=2812733 RepID=A0ABT1WCS4_9PROT|nr:hypothetical protein [Acetobacteraceae bacterium KSS8]
MVVTTRPQFASGEPNPAQAGRAQGFDDALGTARQVILREVAELAIARSMDSPVRNAARRSAALKLCAEDAEDHALAGDADAAAAGACDLAAAEISRDGGDVALKLALLVRRLLERSSAVVNRPGNTELALAAGALADLLILDGCALDRSAMPIGQAVPACGIEHWRRRAATLASGRAQS